MYIHKHSCIHHYAIKILVQASHWRSSRRSHCSLRSIRERSYLFHSEDDKQFYWVVRKKDKQLEHGYVIDPRNFLSYALTWNVRKLDWENPPKAAVCGEVYRAVDHYDDGPDQ